MVNNETKAGKYRRHSDNWQLSVLLGILFLIGGVIVFFEPARSYMALSILFGIAIVLSGLFGLYMGMKIPVHAGKGWMIFTGVIELILGILLLAVPSMLLSMLPFVLGFWLLYRGLLAVGFASDMMGCGVKGMGWSLALGILVIIGAMMILFNPLLGVGVAVVWLGVALLLAGIDLISHGINLRRLQQRLR